MPDSADSFSESPCESCGCPIDTSEQAPLATVHCPHCDHPNVVNTQFHHFQLQEIIGSGGMGAVYRAYDQSLNRTVALKLLRTEHMTDPSIVTQFEREAAITAAINHPNVVKVFSTGADHGTVYIVMELVDKGSLDDLMSLQGRISEAQVLEIGIQIARGLQAAWRNGLLHRDVKPGNILFNDAQTPKIVDFGLAALTDEQGQIGGEVWGTPYYVAPEKLDSPPLEDFRSDIYSLGSALFHAIAGQPPYEAEDASIVVLRTLKSQPVSLRSFVPDVTDATNAVIGRMMKREPDERYQSYEELIEHMQFARNAIAEGVAPPPPPPMPERGARWVTFGVSALVVAVGAWFLLQHQQRNASKPPNATPPPAMMSDAAERSAAARQLLLSGDAADAARAADAFRGLDRDNVPQPLRSWNALQCVLAQLLAGRTAEAQAGAAQIVERGPISSGQVEECPGQFFVETAALVQTGTPPAAAQADKLAPGTHEAFALLLGGVTNWNAGNIEDAVRFFTRFGTAIPIEPHTWIADYQPLAASFVADHAAFARAVAAEKAVTSPAQKKPALDAVREARTQLKHQSALTGQLTAIETQLAAEVAAHDAEMAAKMAALDAADAAALTAAQPRIDDLCRQFRIADAIKIARAIQLQGQANAAALDFLNRRLAWLDGFKTTFFTDLRTANYRAEVQTMSGGRLAPGLWVPGDASVKVMVPSGGRFETPWANVHPQAIITAVHAMLHPPLTAEQIADRKWGLGLYLLSLRLEAQAHPLLTEASAAREEYRNALPQLGLKLP